VSGVGLSGGRLTIYLETDSDAVRAEVGRVMAREAPDAPVEPVVSGAFTPR